MTAPFWSVTLPMRPFLKVTLSTPWFSTTAELFVVVPCASTSSPSNVTLSEELSSWKSLLPGWPLKVIAFEPDGTYWMGYEPGATSTTSPAAPTVWAGLNDLHGAACVQAALSEPLGATYRVAAWAVAAGS